MSLRAIEAGLVGGLVAGAAVALAARVAMRALAERGGSSSFFPSMVFTLDGTWALLPFIALPAVWLGLLFVAVRRFLPRHDAVAGLVFGLGLLATIGALFLARDIEFARGGVDRDIGRPIFGALFPAFGVLVGVLAGLAWRARFATGALAGYAVGAFFGVTAIVAFLTDLSPLDRDPPLGAESVFRAAVPLVLAVASLAGALALQRGRRSRTWIAAAFAPAGIAALAGLAAGVLQLVDLLRRLA